MLQTVAFVIVLIGVLFSFFIVAHGNAKVLDVGVAFMAFVLAIYVVIALVGYMETRLDQSCKMNEIN